MNLHDTLSLAANNGWQTSTTCRKHDATRADITNLTHLIFAWYHGDQFDCAYLYNAGEFEPILTTTCDSHLTAWIACHALEAAS